MPIHRPPLLACDDCPHSFTSRYPSRLWKHFVLSHGGPRLGDTARLILDSCVRRKAVSKTPATCDECREEILDKYDLLRHIRRYDGCGSKVAQVTEPGRLFDAVCDDCGRHAHRTHMPRHHLQAHSVAYIARIHRPSIKCDDCARLCANKNVLFKHWGAEHAGPEKWKRRKEWKPEHRPKRFVCDRCEARFSAKHNLGKHERKGCL